MKRGLFISFESIDGVGKSTQLSLLGPALERAGAEIFYTKEPGDKHLGSSVGAAIRDVIFYKGGSKTLHPGVSDMLFLADHIQASADISRQVTEGKVVLCDRYADSQFAYGAAASKRSPEWAMDLYRAQYGLVPDITVLFVARGPERAFTTDPECMGNYTLSVTYNREDIGWAIRRAQSRRGEEAGKQEGKAWNNEEEQWSIQQTYLANLEPQARTIRVDVWEKDTIEEVHMRLLAAIRDRMKLHLTYPEALTLPL